MSNDKIVDNALNLIERIKKDSRFEKTVSAVSKCALVLWLLDIKQNDQVEYRLMYGWVIPSKFSPSDTWRIADGGSYQKLNGTDSDLKYRIPRLTLYSTGEKITQLIEYLAQGLTLEAASSKLGIIKCQKFAPSIIFKSTDQPVQLSTVTFCGTQYNEAFYRGENAYHSPSSHSPAFSVSLCGSNRENPFTHAEQTRLSQEKLVIDCLEYLASETNFDFKGASLTRLGCIEWLEFPFMDEYEREQIQISTLGLKIESTDKPGLRIKLGKHCFQSFKEKNTSILLSIRIFNNERIAVDEAYEDIVDKEHDFEKVIEVGFKFQRALVNIKIRLETGKWILWYEENVTIIGSIIMSIGLSGSSINARTDWLDKLLNSRAKPLAEQASTIQRVTYMEGLSITDKEGRIIPPIADLLKKYKLKNTITGAWFFQKAWPADQAAPGFFQFWKWFNERVATRTDGATILIIDPYFDAPGITEFIARVSVAQVKFVVLANTQVRSDDDDEHATPTPQSDTADTAEPIRATRLRQACESVYYLLSELDVQILDLRSNRGGKGQLFHDRYIFIKDASGEASAGYHLSNSFQGAAKKYPLLITPIPENILSDLDAYLDGLLSADSTVISEAKVIELFSTAAYRKQLREQSKPQGDVFEILKNKGLDGSVFQTGFIDNNTISTTAALHVEAVANILISSTTNDFPRAWLAACTWFAGDFGAHCFAKKLSAPILETILERLILLLKIAPGLPIPVGTQGTPPDRWLLPIASLFKEEFIQCLAPADRILHHALEQYRVGTLSVRIAIALLMHYGPAKLFAVAEILREELSGNALVCDNDRELLARAVIFYQTVAVLESYIYFKEELTPILLSSSVPLYRALAVQRLISTIRKAEGSLESVKLVLDRFAILKPGERLQATITFCNAFVRFLVGSGSQQDENIDASLNAILNAIVDAWPIDMSHDELVAIVDRLIENPIGLPQLYEQGSKMLLTLHEKGKIEIIKAADFWTSKVMIHINNQDSASSFEEAEECLIQVTAQVLSKLPNERLKTLREDLSGKKQRYERTFNGFFMSSRSFAKWYPAVRGLFWIRALVATLLAHKKASHTLDTEEMQLWVKLHQELVQLLVLDTEVQKEITELVMYCEGRERQ